MSRLTNYLAKLIGQSVTRRPAVRSRGLSRACSPSYASAGIARLAVCARMSTPCLLRRVARGRWSRTSHTAAVRVLMDRDAQGARV